MKSKVVTRNSRKDVMVIIFNDDCDPALKPGRVIRVTFSPGHPGLTRFTIYPGLTRFTIYAGLTRFTIYAGLTRIGSREKRNCSFDDVEIYKRYRVALS